MTVTFHADDFGITLDQSRRILALSSRCGGEGALGGVSVLVNGPQAEACADLLKPHAGRLRVCLHVNLVEGRCCADPAEIPLLVNDTGMFSLGYGAMLAGSAGPRAAELRRQMACEIEAQIDRFLGFFPDARERFCVDSHQHTHLVPVAFGALGDALASRGCRLAYLRVPAEPLAPFLTSPASLARIPPVNWVKHALLNALWRFDRRSFPELAAQAEAIADVFCGINYSGCMTPSNVRGVLPAFEAYARRRGKGLELLFHPGGIDRAEDSLNPGLEGFVAFETSPLRAEEARSLRMLGQAAHGRDGADGR